MTNDRARPNRNPDPDLDDDDVPKAYVRPGDDPMLDEALARLKGEGGDDPLFRDMSGDVNEITDPGSPPAENHAEYVEPITVPPGRDPTIEQRRVVIAEPLDSRKAPTQRMRVVEARSGLAPLPVEPAAPRTLGHTARLADAPPSPPVLPVTGGVPPLAARTLGGRTERRLPAATGAATPDQPAVKKSTHPGLGDPSQQAVPPPESRRPVAAIASAAESRAEDPSSDARTQPMLKRPPASAVDVASLPSTYAPTSVPAPSGPTLGTARRGAWVVVAAGGALACIVLWVVLRSPSAPSDTRTEAATATLSVNVQAPTGQPSAIAATAAPESAIPSSAAPAPAASATTRPQPGSRSKPTAVPGPPPPAETTAPPAQPPSTPSTATPAPPPRPF